MEYGYDEDVIHVHGAEIYYKFELFQVHFITIPFSI